MLKEPRKRKEKIGQTFGKLTIIKFGHYKFRSDGRRDAFWKCKCECGKEKFATFGNLHNGNVSSCGCMVAERLTQLHKNNIDDSATFRMVLAEYKKSAAKYQRTFSLTDDEFRELTSGICHYCGTPPAMIKERNGKIPFKGKHYVYNGVDRVDNSRGYETDNCVSCCRRCNIAKSGMTVDEFLSWAKRIYEWNV